MLAAARTLVYVIQPCMYGAASAAKEMNMDISQNFSLPFVCSCSFGNVFAFGTNLVSSTTQSALAVHMRIVQLVSMASEQVLLEVELYSAITAIRQVELLFALTILWLPVLQVNSMDRSFLLRIRGKAPDEPIQIAKLVDAKETRGMYYVEYTVEKQPGPKRHLYSTVALRFNGRYNRLYTLTAQCLEDQVQQVEPVLKQILGSFQPPAVAV